MWHASAGGQYPFVGFGHVVRSIPFSTPTSRNLTCQAVVMANGEREGWWLASDGCWYPPHLHPDAYTDPPQTTDSIAQAPDTGKKSPTPSLKSLRRADNCASCGADLPVGTKAWWNPKMRAATCVEHGNPDEMIALNSSPTNPDVDVLERNRGIAGKSAAIKYERLRAGREAKLDKKFGRASGIVKFVTSEPQSMTAWSKGATGEKEVAKRLESIVGDNAELLYDRSVPGTNANIDIVAVAPSGVWVIDVKNYSGQVERRDVGGFFRTDFRLYVGGRNRSEDAKKMAWQVDAVTKALSDDSIAVHSALCFYNAEWRWFAKPFLHNGVWVTWPGKLAVQLCEPIHLAAPTIRMIAEKIAVALPSK